VLRALALRRGPSLFDLAAADGGTPAMSAAVHGEAAALRELAGVADLDAQDHDGWTALMFACCAGHPRAVAVLVAAGADPALCNAQGETAEALAHRNGYAECLHALRCLAKAPEPPSGMPGGANGGGPLGFRRGPGAPAA